MKIKKLALVIATSSLMGLGAGVAQAGALATSVAGISNFIISYTGGATVDAGDFSTLTFTQTADTSADLNGNSDTKSGSSQDAVPIDLFSSIGSHPGYTDNDFSILSSVGGYPTGNFAIGDSNAEDNPITGLPIGALGANISNASYVSLEGAGVGSATSNNGLSATLVFVAGKDGTLDFDFDFRAYLETYLDVGDAHPSFASSSFSISFLLVEDGGFNPATLLQEDFTGVISSNAPGTGIANGVGFTLGVPLTGHTTYTSAAVVAGTRYQLTARITTEADAQYVPEPSALLLMGLGLVGLVAVYRRKNGVSASYTVA